MVTQICIYVPWSNKVCMACICMWCSYHSTHLACELWAMTWLGPCKARWEEKWRREWGWSITPRHLECVKKGIPMDIPLAKSYSWWRHASSITEMSWTMLYDPHKYHTVHIRWELQTAVPSGKGDAVACDRIQYQAGSNPVPVTSLWERDISSGWCKCK